MEFVFAINTILVIDCGALPNITFGSVDVSPNTLENATAEYDCNIGYDLQGSSTRVCLNTGNWSLSQPSCTSKSQNYT